MLRHRTGFVLALTLAASAIASGPQDVRAEPVTTGPRLLGICQTLLGEQSSYCDVITDWSIEKTVDTPLAEQPTRRAIGYTIRVIEGLTRYVLGMTSIVTLDGLIPEGTQVRGIVVNLQKADPNDPNYDPLDPLSQPRHTTVASAVIGDTDPSCGCPYVSPSQAGGLTVTLRDTLGNTINTGEDNVIEMLAYGERVMVQLDAVYDLSAGIVLPGDSVRIQACVQYAAADEADISGCFDSGGAVRSVRACRGFDFETYAQPRSATVTLEEALAAPSNPWVVLTGFRARSLSELITPPDLFGVMPGGDPVTFQVTASGSPGTESTLSVKGNVSCGDIVDCGGATTCTGFITNTGTLDFQDSRGRVSSTAVSQIICSAHQCSATQLASCNDDDPCTTDTCAVGQGCIHTPYEGACDDGNACTTGEMCVSGVCTGGGPAAPCTDDDNPCTDEFCDPDAGCVRVVKPNRARCEDGNLCTIDDICMEGICVSGAAVSCDDGNACTQDFCGVDGQCVNAPIAGGAGSCDDGDPCTVGDRCGGGGCLAGSPRTCAADNNACTSDACVPMLGCVYAPVANSSPCSDGSACTVGDQCAGGACVAGAPANCNDGNACTNDGCDAELGCFNAPRTGPCDDGSACTTASACIEGQCRGTQVRDCDDGNPCTVDSCDAVLGCRNIVVANGTGCDDGDTCSTGETCQQGTCLATALVDCDDGNQCTTSACVPGEGCVHLPRSGSCQDGNACTGPDVCSGTSCVAGAAVTCDDGNACTQDVCDPALGCQYLPVSVGSCDDGNLCTGAGACVAGQCQAGTPISCEDGNPCTAGTCDAVMGCVQTQISGPCDDGNACTGPGTCRTGTCTPGTPISCDDGNACTADACVAGLGCQNVPRNDVPCSDANACTVDDRCVQGQCVAGVALDCNDNNPCTLDTCGAQGCVYTPAAGGCSDGNPCTLGDVCSAGLCQGGDAKNCDDGNSCTSDACLPATGLCQYAVISSGLTCDDGEACTGCPWPESSVRRGFHARDAQPDPSLWSGVVAVAFELDSFLGPGTGKAQFSAQSGTRFLVLPNGSATLRGNLKVDGLSGNELWSVSMNFAFRGVGRAGQGGTPFYELPTTIQSTSFTDHWEYWTLGSGAGLTRVSGGADSAAISPDATLQSLPFQVGLRANGRNLGYGAAMPIRWTRGTRSGSGVIRLDLIREFCDQSDVCSAGACVGGTESTECRDIAVGDYCTYDDRDFGTACGTDPTTAGCVLAQNFSAIALERTFCSSTQRGVAFGFTGYRRWGFLTANRIDLFLPTVGSGTTLTDLCNPLATTASPFVGRAFALDLSIRLSDVGALPAPGSVPFGDLVRTTGSCAGLSLREIARRAEAVASYAPTGATSCNTLSVLDAEVTTILQGFRGCQSMLEGVVLPE